MTKPLSKKARVPENVFDACATAVSQSGLLYLGRAEFASEKFKILPRWPGHEVDPREKRAERYLFYIVPGKQLLVEIHLYEQYEAGVVLSDGSWFWEKYWHIVLRGVVHWEVPGVMYHTYQDPRELCLRNSSATWDHINLSPGIYGRTPLSNSDYQALEADVELPQDGQWSEGEFPDVLARNVQFLLARSNLLKHVESGKIPELRGMLPRPQVVYRLADCMDNFWAQYPITELLKHCEEQACREEYEREVTRFSNAWYANFNTRFRES
jgi:hypothetical protein